MFIHSGLSSCLLVLSMSIVTSGYLIDISPYKTLITLMHNLYRSQEQAADMKEIKWDAYMQQRAEEWSENCYWGHQSKGLGENLAFFWTNGPESPPVEYIVKAHQNWWKEVHDWSWGTECGVACHYTQMIWGKSEKIGCALSKCAKMRMDGGKSRDNANYFVCFYDPPGNFVGRLPYTRGKSCSKCEQGDTCNKGLCSSPAYRVKPATNKYTSRRRVIIAPASQSRQGPTYRVRPSSRVVRRRYHVSVPTNQDQAHNQEAGEEPPEVRK